MAKKLWVKPLIKTIEAGSAENKKTTGPDGGGPGKNVSS